jgi:exo-1,4-beta-D-glucosaminidase
VDAGVDSSQLVAAIPDSLFSGAERLFFIDLTLSNAAGHVVSRNFYWVPGTLTTFDWQKTDYTHTPAARHEDLTALKSLPQAQVASHAAMENTEHGREVRLRLDNSSSVLAFQVHAAVRTQSGGLIAPVFWSDNWIELDPGESRTLTATLPEDAGVSPVVELEGWNVKAVTISPSAAGQPTASAH